MGPKYDICWFSYTSGQDSNSALQGSDYPHNKFELSCEICTCEIKYEYVEEWLRN